MRLPFPERIPLSIALLFAAVLAALQQLQHTDLNFSLCSFVFIVVATITFNTAGGFTRPSGSYIFFYSTLGAILGLVFKAYLGEPGDSNLQSPLLTIQVFTGGIVAMLFATIVSKKITRSKPFLGTILKEADLRNAAIGCFSVGVALALANAAFSHQNGSILSAIQQLNRFLQMSVILATIYTIRRSGGRTGISILVGLTIGFSFLNGVLTFSKEGMFTPLLCWIVTACSLRLRVRLPQILLIVVVSFSMFHYMVPYSQYGRNQIGPEATYRDRFNVAVELLSNPNAVRQNYLESEAVDIEGGPSGYYNKPQGFFDRLCMIPPDDLLITYTNQGNYAGLSSIPIDFLNWIPHFLMPNKAGAPGGNYYARQIGGIIGEDDETTGISFTPSGEAFQMAGWTGIFLVAPLIWIMVFTVFDSLCGDVRRSPWGLLVTALFAHVAPEGMIGGAIYITWFGAVGIVFVALASAYVMPVIGSLIAGAGKTQFVSLRRPDLVLTRGMVSTNATKSTTPSLMQTLKPPPA